MSFDVIGFLRDVSPFNTLAPAALTGIARLIRIRDFAAGERIIARGEPGDAMYIVYKGEVRVPIFDPSGQEKMVARLTKGQFFGEMSLMTGDPRAADVYAASEGPVGTLVIPKDAFHQITRATPSLARFLTQILADRLSEGGLMASKTIGKYQLLGELGRGGMSVVYNGLHTTLHRQVAVKMLNHQLAFDERFRAQFQQEALVIARLNHENIVNVYDTEQAYATYFIVMEFVQGTPLSKLIESSGRVPPHQARDILIQMCRALDFAHDNGIVHRDVKPTNVIMTPDGRVKLMDFGIARVRKGGVPGEGSATSIPGEASRSAEDEEIVGTAEYMAPEQIQASGIDRRTDVYALGITAYQMLTGELPFVSPNPYEVLLAHVTKPMPSIREKLRDLPGDLADFVDRATRKDPAERFKTLEEAERMLTSHEGVGSGVFGAREGRIVTLFYPPSEAGAVDRAIEALKAALAGNRNIRMAAQTLTPP